MSTAREVKQRVSDRAVLRFRPGLRLSDSVFERLCRANPELRLERTAKDELIIRSPANPDASQRNLELVALIWTWNRRRRLGVCFESSAGFTLPNNAIRSPDAAWMSRARWEALSDEEREKFSHVVPDFVAEIKSKSDTMPEVRKKMREYIAQGVRLGWLIDPKRRLVEIYRPGRAVERLENPATLSGEDVLLGLVLDLKGILFE
jgi:Uma2 family endonuclease